MNLSGFKKIFLFYNEKHPWCVDKYAKIRLQNCFDVRCDGGRIGATFLLHQNSATSSVSLVT